MLKTDTHPEAGTGTGTGKGKGTFKTPEPPKSRL